MIRATSAAQRRLFVIGRSSAATRYTGNEGIQREALQREPAATPPAAINLARGDAVAQSGLAVATSGAEMWPNADRRPASADSGGVPGRRGQWPSTRGTGLNRRPASSAGSVRDLLGSQRAALGVRTSCHFMPPDVAPHRRDPGWRSTLIRTLQLLRGALPDPVLAWGAGGRAGAGAESRGDLRSQLTASLLDALSLRSTVYLDATPRGPCNRRVRGDLEGRSALARVLAWPSADEHAAVDRRKPAVAAGVGAICASAPMWMPQITARRTWPASRRLLNIWKLAEYGYLALALQGHAGDRRFVRPARRPGSGSSVACRPL